MAEPEPEPMEEEAAPKKAKKAKTEAVVNQEELAPLLRVGAVVDAAAVAFGETYVKQARNGGPKSFRGTIVAASVEDDHWNVKYDEDGEVFATEAQHLTLVSAPSDDDAPARRAKKRAPPRRRRRRPRRPGRSARSSRERASPRVAEQDKARPYPPRLDHREHLLQLDHQSPVRVLHVVLEAT